MIVILLGSPGSGKGTQSKILSARYGFVHLATGDVFRAEMQAKTPLGVKAADYVKAGRLVPDAVVTEMVAGRLDSRKDYLLDGFPRNLDQATALSRLLSPAGQTVNLAIFLSLPRQEALRRLASRMVCVKCGEVYNAAGRPPRTAGKCDACGGEVVVREDDKDATAEKRIMIFEDLTKPLVAYYKAEGVLREVDAAKSPDAVAEELSSIIESARVRS
ncbi:MAG: nucleoside monophosphate kinase [Elusimicrobia bacterium]|nr:nucleoside monophosphate kinase [Elusimicrobiota bacterium]MDE2313240.1 nucleoside monophosphate kinase [Elusimicrobiota bacterium]